MSLLDSLNPHQKRAVTHTEGPLLILAGAGSGKTRVITHRIAYLIEEKRIYPASIFAVTFTNKATEEMRNRVIGLVGPKGAGVFIKTFHAASVYLLRRFGERIGVSPTFSIYDQADQASLIKEILVRMRLDPKKVRPEGIASTISTIKDKAELIEGADPSLLLPKSRLFDYADLYRAYHEELARNNALDFNDLLIKTVQLLRSDSEVLARLQSQWRYFMIDEYQDTNHAQYLIAKYLASQSRNICVVGDDDQSIYSWRGADIRNILNFEQDYRDATVVTLGTNYRSTEPILHAAWWVIRNNTSRKDKELVAAKGDGEPVVFYRASDEYDEAVFVMQTLKSLKSKRGYRNRHFAVFYRTNAQSRVFEDILRRENTPYRVVGGLKFYDRKEIKDILAYLRVIVNPSDTVSLKRIINAPSRGIGKATIDRIEEAAASKGVSPWIAIRDGLVEGKSAKGLREFRECIIQSQQACASGQSLTNVVQLTLDTSGYKQALEEEDTDESIARLENIDEFMNSVYEYEQNNPEATLEQFLQDISLYTSEENPQGEEAGDAVTLMTVHNAKGLEFPVVFLTGLEEDLFPHRLSIGTEEGVEEERRLFYVGMTRAMDLAFITSAQTRRIYQEICYRLPSRFIYEIPPHLLSSEGGIEDAWSDFSHRPTAKRQGPVSIFEEDEEDSEEIEEPEEPAVSAASKFRIGDRVAHPTYGKGFIVRILGSGDNVKLCILFNSGIKTFLERYTPLEKV